MNTPAHAVLNLTLLAGGERRRRAPAVFLGALLPDLPMYVFFLWERGVMGVSGPALWSVGYFEPHWQDFFDLFNSIPLAALALALCWRAGHGNGIAFSASVLLHQLTDLPLHREDAHRHFLPFSSFRFESPVSYWDPQHHGAWLALGETALVVAGAFVLWRRTGSRGWRFLLAGLAVFQAAVWAAFYGLGVALPG